MGRECKGKLNVRKPHFYHLFNPSSTSQSLRVPDGFVHQMEGATCGLVSLTGPSGNTWQVRLVEQDNHLFFHHGWSTFVGDHHLQYGDLLVFRYEGHLHFTVQVFGENACEKEAAFHSECNLNSLTFNNIEGQKSDAEMISSLDVVGDVQKKMRCDAIENQEPELAIAGKNQSNYELVRPISMIRETEETCKECSASAVHVPFQTGNSNEVEDAAILYRSGKEDDHNILSGASLSKLSAHDEKKIAQSFTSSFPYFVKILKNGNVGGSRTLRIPRRFSAAHLPDDKTEVTLRNSRGECWTVNSVPYAKRGMLHTFCGGWMSFVRDNGVNFGDTCIFELVSDYVMQVHIYGVGKESINNQNGHVKLDNK